LEHRPFWGLININRQHRRACRGCACGDVREL